MDIRRGIKSDLWPLVDLCLEDPVPLESEKALEELMARSRASGLPFKQILCTSNPEEQSKWLKGEV